MMTREQRIDYEILDFALNASRDANGYVTTVPAFLNRLRELFSDIASRELTDACKRLVTQNALHLQRYDKSSSTLLDYQDERDDVTFFDSGSEGICFKTKTQSQRCFRQLSALIEAPVGFKP